MAFLCVKQVKTKSINLAVQSTIENACIEEHFLVVNSIRCAEGVEYDGSSIHLPNNK